MMSKPSILVIAADLNPQDLGGAEVHLVETLKRLVNKYSFTVLVGPDDAIKNIWPSSVQVLPVKYPQIPNFHSFLFIIWAIFKGMSLCLRNKYALVWAKQEFPQAPVAAILHLVFRMPFYITAQNPRAYQEEFVISGLMATVGSLINMVCQPLVAFSLKQATITGAVSSYSEGIAQKFGAKKVALVPNGVDTDKFIPQEAVHQKKKIIITTTSTLIPRNALDIVITSLSLLPTNFKWQFLIAGDGPEKTNLEKQISKLGLTAKIKFLGTLPSDQIVKLLTSSDIYVRPSRYEGFGASFLEAMAMKVPVITTHSGGQKDFIFPENTGLIVPVDDPKEVAKAITRLVTDHKLYEYLQTSAYQLVQQKYSWAVVAEKIDTIFQKII